MNAFKLRRFNAIVILQCVRWYCKYTISYRQLEEMMAERGVAVDHTTIWRWIQRYSPQLEKEVRWYQGYTGGSWRVDETCIRVNGEWKWLFRAVNKQGRTIDFLLTHRRNAKAARRFLAKALRTRQHWPPHVINTDKNPAYGAYCAWLASETGQPYQLPSEAEWEYAARAGTTTCYAFGDAITPKDAKYLASKLNKATEVGAYPPNAWGLYDMYGNVWEWRTSTTTATRVPRPMAPHGYSAIKTQLCFSVGAIQKFMTYPIDLYISYANRDKQ